MPRWLEILLTLILFAVAMGIIGLGVRAVVPSFDAWLVSHTGEAGASATVALGLLGLALYAYRGHRRAGM